MPLAGDIAAEAPLLAFLLAGSLLTVLRWHAVVERHQFGDTFIEALLWSCFAVALILFLSLLLDLPDVIRRELHDWLGPAWPVFLPLVLLVGALACALMGALALPISPVLIPYSMAVLYVARGAYRLAGGRSVSTGDSNTRRRLARQAARSAGKEG